MRYEPTGLQQYGNASNHRNFLDPFQISPRMKVFGAWVYCLKVNDMKSADALQAHLRCVDADECVCGIGRIRRIEKRKVA
jgi:hypothetical protein